VEFVRVNYFSDTLIVLLISGAALAIARYLPTNWNKEFFGMSEIQVVGNAYTVFKFYGEMA
jgi:hypothetical protein